MKNLILALSLLLVLACSEKQNNEKIIYADFKEYYSEDEVNEVAILENENSYKFKQELKNLLGEKSSEGGFSSKLLINEKGNIDKIIVLESLGKNIDKLFIEKINQWKFKPAQIAGNNVKFVYEWNYSNSEYFETADEMPYPIEGMAAIQKKIIYPRTAKENGINGRVFVRAFINENGKVDKTEVIKGIGSGCDSAAIKAVKETVFTPGKQNNKYVKTVVVVPILFKLN